MAYRPIACVDCGVSVQPTTGNQKRCEPCAYAAQCKRSTLRRAAQRGADPYVVACLDCGTRVPRRGPTQVRCSPCAARDRKLHLARETRRHERIVGSEAYRARCREATRRRRALKRSCRRERYTDEQVLSAHGAQCSLCSGPIDLALRSPDPMSYSVDHVVPLYLGGADALDNVRPAHRTCNTRKGWRGFLIVEGAA